MQEIIYGHITEIAHSCSEHTKQNNYYRAMNTTILRPFIPRCLHHTEDNIGEFKGERERKKRLHMYRNLFSSHQ